MKAFKLNLKLIIAAVSIFTLLIYSLVLILFHNQDTGKMGKILLDYGYIITPTTFLWILSDGYLWHTKLLQVLRRPLNIPPDLRGRWEGTLENAVGNESQKFVIEVKQTLTTLGIHSYSTIAHSASILSEIATSENEDKFTLCYLWEGEIYTSIKDIHQRETFYGYTMLHLYENESPKVLKGSYFTNLKSSQTRGGIVMTWTSSKLTKKLD